MTAQSQISTRIDALTAAALVDGTASIADAERVARALGIEAASEEDSADISGMEIDFPGYDGPVWRGL